MLVKCKQFLLLSMTPAVLPIYKQSSQLTVMVGSSCYSCHKPGDKSWMRKELDYDYDKRNISMVMWHRLSVTHMSSAPVFSVVCVTWSLVFCAMICRSLFVLLSFFFWPLHCLSLFDLRLLITPLVSIKWAVCKLGKCDFMYMYARGSDFNYVSTTLRSDFRSVIISY
jgi:hypothetical protein